LTWIFSGFCRAEEEFKFAEECFLRMVSTPKRPSFQCLEIQSCMQTGTQLHLGMNPWVESQEPAYDLFEKSWHLCISGVVATLQFAGPLPSRQRSQISLRLSSDAGALFQRQGVTFKF
jgi:hypothetical protein